MHQESIKKVKKKQSVAKAFEMLQLIHQNFFEQSGDDYETQKARFFQKKKFKKIIQ